MEFGQIHHDSTSHVRIASHKPTPDADPGHTARSPTSTPLLGSMSYAQAIQYRQIHGYMWKIGSSRVLKKYRDECQAGRVEADVDMDDRQHQPFELALESEMAMEEGKGSLDVSESQPRQATVETTTVEQKKSGSSWASLFKASSSQPNGETRTSVGHNEGSRPRATSDVTIATTTTTQPFDQKSLIDIIQSFNPTSPRIPSMSVRPRGLLNRGNTCFMNAILQCLLYCPPLSQLGYMLSRTVFDLKYQDSVMLLEAWIRFYREFELVHTTTPSIDQGGTLTLEARHGEEVVDAPVGPEYIYDALKADQKLNSQKGRQEDAQEFLGVLLDGLHEEMVEILRIYKQTRAGKKKGVRKKSSLVPSPNSVTSSGSDVAMDAGWIEVTSKRKLGKATVTATEGASRNGNAASKPRHVTMASSPITRIFGGTIRSTVSAPDVPDSITIEPFHSLQLDLSPGNVMSVEQALKNLTLPDVIEEFQISPTPASTTAPTHNTHHHHQSPGHNATNNSSNTSTCAPATKQILLESVPPVLVLHLKRFMFDSVTNKTVKLRKPVAHGDRLVLEPQLFSSDARAKLFSGDDASSGDGGGGGIVYQLFGVVYHHGKSASDGHYTCSVLHTPTTTSAMSTANGTEEKDDTWLYFDDAIVTSVTAEQVTEPVPDRSEYLLFYYRHQ